jgi:hypothetical protein
MEAVYRIFSSMTIEASVPQDYPQARIDSRISLMLDFVEKSDR